MKERLVPGNLVERRESPRLTKSREYKGCEYKAVLFDLDDTLYDQREWLSGAFLLVGGYLEEEFGIPAREAQTELCQFARRYGSASGTLINRLLASHGIEEKPELLRSLVTRFYRHRPKILKPYEGVQETLETICDAGLACGVISNGRYEVQLAKIEALGIRNFFTVIQVSGMFGDCGKKPATLMYRKALEELGLKGTSCVYVGDNPGIDFAPAREMGYLTIRVLKGEYAEVVAAQGMEADSTIDEIPDLLAILGIQRRHDP